MRPSTDPRLLRASAASPLRRLAAAARKASPAVVGDKRRLTRRVEPSILLLSTCDGGPALSLRQSNLDHLDDQEFDVLIIGGGINGAVSASSLTSRGAKVALIDRGDFGGYTSQESSNLVWGGIKYLEGYEFGLVWKLCKARNQLIKAYPSFIREIRFLATIPKGFRKPRFMVFMGALLYWVFGRFFTKRPRLFSNASLRKTEPRVDTAKAQGAVEYSDAYLVDADSRFVFRFIREALDHGAKVANYVESLGGTWTGRHWKVRAKDLMSGRELTIRAKVLVNAAGPFVDEHNKLTGIRTEHHHLFSKGIHLIVNRLTRGDRALAFFASDGRLFFVAPLGARSAIGTTDTRVDALPPVVTAEDRGFVLDNINSLLDLDEPLTEADIIAERCGVRPLVVSERRGDDGDDGDWTSLSRKHAIDVDVRRHHLSVFGGKLTDCINVGDEVARAVKDLGVRFSHYDHRWFGENPSVRAEYYHQATLMGLDALTHPDSSELLSTRLWRRYGARALTLLEEIRRDPCMGQLLIDGTEYIRCELHHAARHEMVTKLEDFLRRRSKIDQVTDEEAVSRGPGMLEACRILFGEEQAQAKLDEYFADKAKPGWGKRGLAKRVVPSEEPDAA
ncbi:MAG: FAD-dependent oxidoreductase [Proteobacteria bacterium]|nr:MAG: FAD-dependent oxidoreductase [Pseudomonadota bacterium]